MVKQQPQQEERPYSRKAETSQVQCGNLRVFGLNLDGGFRIPRFRACQGVLYYVDFLLRDGKELLVAAGDEGVVVFSWQSVLDCAARGKHDESPTRLANYKPHTSHEIVEVNGFDTDQDGHIYGAAGDAFGCYKWDMETEKVLKTYPSAQRGYLHTVKVPPSTSGPGHVNVLIGGEDGIMVSSRPMFPIPSIAVLLNMSSTKGNLGCQARQSC